MVTERLTKYNNPNYLNDEQLHTRAKNIVDLQTQVKRAATDRKDKDLENILKKYHQTTQGKEKDGDGQ